ncbi:sigma-70 family RNA polymerase sigma factor [Candidatus Poribacteria bacterium]|nr:sigma-70 family RNA polymerase sigma factor [Candidatus Poribacteria bacterium]
MKNIDVQLIHKVLDGDDSAFAELVEKYQKQVHALVWRKIGDFHIAEEITQDTFLKAYQKLGTLKQPQRFASWLYVIAANRCNTWLRKKYLRKQLLKNKETSQSDNLTYSEHLLEENKRITAETQRDVVKKLLEKLEESERTVMTLHYFGEMSCPEIGEFLGVSSNTIKSRLHRAKQRLQKEEVIIREALDNFQISPYLTENIMHEISRMKPAAPSSGKPVVPWAVAASTLVVMLLILGFGNSKYMTRFQEPYSLEANAEMTVEIVDAPLVANLESKPDIRSNIGNINAQSEINIPDPQHNDAPAVDADAQVDEIAEDWTKWELPKAAKARLGKGGINTMQFSPDGTLLAVGSNIGIWLYDAKTGKEITMFPGACQSIAFSPDGRLLANGGGKYGSGGRFRGKELTLWEVVTGKRAALTGDHLPASELMFSEDGKTLISLGNWGDSISQLDIETKNGNVKMIEDRSWKMIKSRNHPEPYALMHDKFAVGRKDGKIELWDTTTGKKVSTLGIQEKNIQGPLPPEVIRKINQDQNILGEDNEHVLALAFSSDGTRLASGSKDTNVHIWDTHNNVEPIILRKHTGWVNAVTFSPDNKIVASGSTDKKVLLWNATTGELLAMLTGHVNGISALTFSPDGTTLASASTDGTVLFWHTKTGDQLPKRITGHTEWIKAIAFLKDNHTIVSIAYNGIISTWDLNSSQKTRSQNTGHQDFLSSIAFSPDGTKFASFGATGKILFEAGVGMSTSQLLSGGSLRLTDVHTGRELDSLSESNNPIESNLTISPDGKMVAYGGDGKISVWNTVTDSLLNIPISDKVQLNQNGDVVLAPGVIPDKPHQFPMKLPSDPLISALAFSLDGKKIVSGTGDGMVQMWDVETGVMLTSFLEKKPKQEMITALSYASNDALLAVGSNKRIRVFGSKKLTEFEDVNEGVETLMFSPDDTVLVTGLRNGGIELWDIETGDKLTTLDGHSAPVSTLVFSPDHKTLVSTGYDGTILVWDWDEVQKLPFKTVN